MDVAAYRSEPLTAAVLAQLTYLEGLERSTLTYLRRVLVTPTHSDAWITAFLTAWAFEKYWMADALEVVRAAHTAPPLETSRRDRWAKARRSVAERLEPIGESIIANLVGDDVIGSHCLVAAADELVVQSAYRALDELACNAELSRLVDRLLMVKHRHLAFFENQTRERLATSERARGIARRRLRRTQLPLGSPDLPGRASTSFFSTLFTRDAVADIDEQIGRYPGLTGQRALRRSTVRAAMRGGSR